MSDLISRKRVLSLIKQACNPYGKPTIDFKVGKRMMQVVEQMPSADILDHARAIKEYCENTDCKECFIKKRCGGCGWEGLRPFKWDLPEGEKE